THTHNAATRTYKPDRVSYYITSSSSTYDHYISSVAVSLLQEPLVHDFSLSKALNTALLRYVPFALNRLDADDAAAYDSQVLGHHLPDHTQPENHGNFTCFNSSTPRRIHCRKADISCRGGQIADRIRDLCQNMFWNKRFLRMKRDSLTD